MDFDADTLEAIGHLLNDARQQDLGITFRFIDQTRDEQGEWEIGYLIGHGGGYLLSDPDLGAAARSALTRLSTAKAEHYK